MPNTCCDWFRPHMECARDCACCRGRFWLKGIADSLHGTVCWLTQTCLCPTDYMLSSVLLPQFVVPANWVSRGSRASALHHSFSKLNLTMNMATHNSYHNMTLTLHLYCLCKAPRINVIYQPAIHYVSTNMNQLPMGSLCCMSVDINVIVLALD